MIVFQPGQTITSSNGRFDRTTLDEVSAQYLTDMDRVEDGGVVRWTEYGKRTTHWTITDGAAEFLAEQLTMDAQAEANR